MSTLRELLKDRELPVRVKESDGMSKVCLELRYIHNDYAYGHDENNCPVFTSLDADYLSIVEPPKPRLLAWRYVDYSSNKSYGTIYLFLEQETASLFVKGWERCPHLDEPVRDEP